MRRRAERRIVLRLALASALAAGCAAPGPSARSGDPDAAGGSTAASGWIAARARDFVRCFDLALAFGPGLGARATITRHVQAGALVVDPVSRSPRHLRSVNVSVGVREGEVGAWSLRQIEYGLSPWYQSEALIRPVPSAADEQRIDPSATRDARLGAQVHLGLIGLEAGFDPLAFVRFVAGLFGLEGEPPDSGAT